MQIGFTLEDHEAKVTPIKTAEALIECRQFDHKDLKEIIAYLSVYTKYHANDPIPSIRRGTVFDK